MNNKKLGIADAEEKKNRDDCFEIGDGITGSFQSRANLKMHIDYTPTSVCTMDIR